MDIFSVIGMGSIARRHVRNLRHLHPGARILAVSSSGANTNCPDGADAVVTLETVLAAAPRYAIIATPAPFHTPVAEQLLGAGVPVLIEKPLSGDHASAAAFAAACPPHPPVRVGYCLRFLSTATMLRDLLTQGRIGRLHNVTSFVGQYLPHWRPDTDFRDSVSARADMGGGALLELSHELDLLNWFLGDLSLGHSWLRRNMGLGLEVEECANLVLTRNDGCHVSVHLDFLQKDVRRRIEFFGGKGRILWDLVANTIDIHCPDAAPERLEGTETDRGAMYLEMLSAFEALLEGRTDGRTGTLATVDQALAVMALVDRAKRDNTWKGAT